MTRFWLSAPFIILAVLFHLVENALYNLAVKINGGVP